MTLSTSPELHRSVHWARGQAVLKNEVAAFSARNPRSQALSARAQAHLLDVDGHSLLDFYVGDTGAHGLQPDAIVLGKPVWCKPKLTPRLGIRA
jgi:glutamate-1-semialdehyde aminotransferase